MPGCLGSVRSVLLGVVVWSVVGACQSPPQILEISPPRGASDVRSNEPVRIRFDRPMNQASVAERFRLNPAVKGSVRWLSDSEMQFEHDSLQPASSYQAILDPGYEDAQGQVNSLRHSWTFTTEAAPSLASTTPGNGDRDVDPATYIGLTFSRPMDMATLPRAVSIAPPMRFSLRPDPADRRRVLVAPESLLAPTTQYEVTVTTQARDEDGNQLGAGSVVSFNTSAARGLQHWIGFVAAPAAGGDGEAVWIVDENAFPRPLVNTPVSSFTWSPDATALLVESPTGTWSDQPLQGSPRPLPFQASWASYVAGGRGYSYLDGGSLRLLRADGQVVDVAEKVSGAAVAPDGSAVAFVTPSTAPPSGSPAPTVATEVGVYVIDTRTEYRLLTETAPIDGLSWSPDGLSVAYRVLTTDANKHQIRVKSLPGSGPASTVATGQVSVASWQADSRHLIFTATVPTNAGPISKAFRVGLGGPANVSLGAASGMPPGTDVSVGPLSVSADGHQIAFLSDLHGLSQVWLMNADGTRLTALTQYGPADFPYRSTEVAWTPT